MNPLEVKLFRYCCKQANYNNKYTGIYVSTNYIKRNDYITNSDEKIETLRASVSVSSISVSIYFQKNIELIFRDFSDKYNIPISDIITIGNRWLRPKCKILVKDRYCNDISEKYHFYIYLGKFYDIIPLRVFNKLLIKNNSEAYIPEPSYEYFKPKVKDLEKKYFRFLVRNCTKKKSYYNGNEFYIKIDDYDKLYKNWTGRTHHTVCSKNATKRFIRKWKSLGMYYEDKEKALHKKSGVNKFSVISISEKEHYKYANIMPKNIFMELKRKWVEDENSNLSN